MTDRDPTYDEKLRLFRVVDQFALEMKARLAKKLDLGWAGWEDADILPVDAIYHRLLACATKGPLAAHQEADIANFALFLWHRRLRADITRPEGAGIGERK